MAKSQTARAVLEEVGDPILEQNSELEQHILAALNATADDVHFKLSVCRVDQQNAREGRIGVFPPTENLDVLLDEIAAKHGTGTYRFRLYRNGVICKQTDMDLIAPPAPLMPVATPSADIASAIASALKEPMTLITTLIAKVTSTPSEKSDITDLVNALGALDTMRGRGVAAPQSPILSAKEMLDLVKQGMELGQQVSNGGGDGGGWMGLVSKLIDKLDLEKLAQAYAAPVNGQTPQLNGPAPQTNGADNPQERPPPQPQVLTPEQQLAGLLRHNVNYLVQRAAANADPELYADWTYDNVPTDVLTGICAQPNAVEILQQIAPGVGAHADWFHELLEKVRLILTEEGKEAQGDATPTGQGDVSTAASANSGATG